MTCDLCHDVTAATHPRGGFLLCTECAYGWDYQASLTPAERRAEERSVAAYCGYIEDSGAAVAPVNGGSAQPHHTKENQ